MSSRKLMMRMHRRLIRSFTEIIRDAEHWNSLNPGCEPIDLEHDRVIIARSRRILERLERFEEVPAAEVMAFEESINAILADERGGDA